MLEEYYPFVVQPLPYEYDALLPVLDEETLHFTMISIIRPMWTS